MMAVIFGFNILFAPSEEEIAQQNRNRLPAIKIRKTAVTNKLPQIRYQPTISRNLKKT